MADCKYCGRSGWFLSVTEKGLCNDCNTVISFDVSQRTRIMNDCIEIISKSKKLETRLSRCDLLIEHAKALLDYERHGIVLLPEPPSSLLATYQRDRERIIVADLERLVSDTLAKAELATSDTTKISQASKSMFVVHDYLDKVKQREPLETLQKRLKDFIHQTQLNAHLEAAKKAEFKGQKKKALDKYRDALYFLKHDEIDDKLQSAHIGSVEQKIAELEKSS